MRISRRRAGDSLASIRQRYKLVVVYDGDHKLVGQVGAIDLLRKLKPDGSLADVFGSKLYGGNLLVRWTHHVFSSIIPHTIKLRRRLWRKGSGAKYRVQYRQGAGEINGRY